jgi:hypothetical protein
VEVLSVPTLSGELREQVSRLARAGRPHPDPVVQRLAVGWVREGARRLTRRAVLYGLGILAVTVPAATAALEGGIPERWFYGWLVLAAGIGIAILAGHAATYGLASTRLRIVVLNLRALVDAEPHGQARPMRSRRTLSDRWLAAYPWAYAALASVLFGADLLRTGFRPRDGFVAVVSTFLVWTAVREWGKPRPPLSIGPAGLSLPRRSTLIPWSAVSGVALLGPDRKNPRRFTVSFRLRERDPIEVDVAALTVPPEELVTSARAYCAS